MVFSDIGAAWRAFWERIGYWLKLGFLVALPSAIHGFLWDLYFDKPDVVATPEFLGAHFALGIVMAVACFILSAVVCRACLRHWREDDTYVEPFANLPLQTLAVLGLLLAMYGTCEQWATIANAETEMGSFAVSISFLQLASWVPLLIVLPLVVDGGRGPFAAILESIRLMFRNFLKTAAVAFLFGLTLFLATVPLFIAGVVTTLWGEADPVFSAIMMSVTMWVMFAFCIPVYYLFVTRVYLQKTHATASGTNP